MKKKCFKILATLNRLFLPSLSKRAVDLAKAKKWQRALIGWRYYVTTNSLD
ncbi:MAG: SsrA-binding protein [Flavobacteriaceae bacterium]|nr:SsrA-binding protein [Flavobacteriaceae bacterium]